MEDGWKAGVGGPAVYYKFDLDYPGVYGHSVMDIAGH